MREVIGYAPIEPDGSVRVKVPANVALAVSVLDGNGRRITARHQNWIAGRAGPGADVQRLPRARSERSRRTAAARRSTPPMPARPSTGVPFRDIGRHVLAGRRRDDGGDAHARRAARPIARRSSRASTCIYDDVWTDPAVRDAGRAVLVSVLEPDDAGADGASNCIQQVDARVAASSSTTRRTSIRSGGAAAQCWIDRWRNRARQQHVRARRLSRARQRDEHADGARGPARSDVTVSRPTRRITSTRTASCCSPTTAQISGRRRARGRAGRDRRRRHGQSDPVRPCRSVRR